MCYRLMFVYLLMYVVESSGVCCMIYSKYYLLLCVKYLLT